MIVSHKYRFIFIKTYKTAGTSLEVCLSEVCGDGDVFTEIFPPVEPHRPRNFDGFYNHMSAREIRSRVGADIWASYFKFCVERNPWDKVLSFYWMEKCRSSEPLTLDDFLQRDQIGLNWGLYADDDLGGPVVDQVVRYESLSEELDSLFKTLNVPWVGLGVNAKSEYRQDRRCYRDVLTEPQAEIVKRRFEREISFHGYRY